MNDKNDDKEFIIDRVDNIQLLKLNDEKQEFLDENFPNILYVIDSIKFGKFIDEDGISFTQPDPLENQFLPDLIISFSESDLDKHFYDDISINNFTVDIPSAEKQDLRDEIIPIIGEMLSCVDDEVDESDSQVTYEVPDERVDSTELNELFEDECFQTDEESPFISIKNKITSTASIVSELIFDNKYILNAIDKDYFGWEAYKNAIQHKLQLKAYQAYCIPELNEKLEQCNNYTEEISNKKELLTEFFDDNFNEVSVYTIKLMDGNQFIKDENDKEYYIYNIVLAKIDDNNWLGLSTRLDQSFNQIYDELRYKYDKHIDKINTSNKQIKQLIKELKTIVNDVKFSVSGMNYENEESGNYVINLANSKEELIEHLMYSSKLMMTYKLKKFFWYEQIPEKIIKYINDNFKEPQVYMFGMECDYHIFIAGMNKNEKHLTIYTHGVWT